MNSLLDELLRYFKDFAEDPTKERSQQIRATLNEIVVADPKMKSLLDRAYSIVARPYQNAKTDMRTLIADFEHSLKN